MAAKQAADIFKTPFTRKLGRAGTNLGWRMVLVAVTFYIFILVLARIFESMLSNLVGV